MGLKRVATYKYNSPVGQLLLRADEDGLFELNFMGESEDENSECIRCGADGCEPTEMPTCGRSTEIIQRVISWLDAYFEGKKPKIDFPIHYSGTAFQMEVWDILRTIPYGEVMSYGQIARIIAKNRGIDRMSAQAVGGAVHNNPIGIIIPCHRVLGSDGSLTGFGGGLEAKKYLLCVEKIRFGC